MHRDRSDHNKEGTHGCSIGAEKEEYLRTMWNTVPLMSLGLDIEYTVDCNSNCDIVDGNNWEEQKNRIDPHHTCHLATDDLAILEDCLCHSYV
jgi:hypothetical protein